MVTNYKYNPADYINVMGLSNELSLFYELHNKYNNNRTRDKWFDLRKHCVDLFFTLKHRALEGAITQNTAWELREYMEELLND